MSNTKDRIAELRSRIAANKGIASRADGSIWRLHAKKDRAERQIRADQYEIEAMGGKVRR